MPNKSMYAPVSQMLAAFKLMPSSFSVGRCSQQQAILATRLAVQTWIDTPYKFLACLLKEESLLTDVLHPVVLSSRGPPFSCRTGPSLRRGTSVGLVVRGIPAGSVHLPDHDAL